MSTNEIYTITNLKKTTSIFKFLVVIYIKKIQKTELSAALNSEFGLIKARKIHDIHGSRKYTKMS